MSGLPAGDPRGPQLTAFDREVLAILLSCGGWNGAARARLASLAARHHVSAQGLCRVLNGLGVLMREGHLADAWVHDHAPGPTAGLPPVVAEPVDLEAVARRSRSQDRAIRVVVVSLLLISLLLAWRLVAVVVAALSRAAPAPMAARSADDAAEAPKAAPSAPEGVNAAAPQRPAQEPSAAAVPPAVPVSYPQVPSFAPGPMTLQMEQAITAAKAAVDGLRALAGQVEPASAATTARWAGLQQAAGAAWPYLDPGSKRALVDASLAVFRTLETEEAAAALVEPLRAMTGAAPVSATAILQGSWSAGIAGSFLAEPGVAPGVVGAATVASVPPVEGSGGAFERSAASWLDRALPQVVAAVGRGAPQDDFDRLQAWIAAQEAVRTPEEAQGAWLAGIDALLRSPLRLEVPGTAADLAGRLVALVDWRPEAPGSRTSRRRLEQWLLDPAVQSRQLWAVTSILRQARRAPWFQPDMVVGERTDAAGRRAILGKVLAALGPAPEVTASAGAAQREQVARWDNLRAALGEAPPSPTPLVLLDRMVRQERLGTIAALVMEGRDREAAQRLAEMETAAGAPVVPALGPGGRARPTQRRPEGDGALEERLARARTADQRLEALRQRRTDLAPDLGPVDAARLVREAYTAEPMPVRLTAQGVVVDSFASGVEVAQAMVDLFPLGGGDEALARFIERYTGERMPPGASGAFRPAATAALLRHRLALVEHPWHGVDHAARLLAAEVAQRVEAEGGAAESLRDQPQPLMAARALAELQLARAAARPSADPVPAPVPELERHARARRAAAEGPVQRFVAEAWTSLELEAFMLAADRPTTAAQVRALLAGTAARLVDANDVLMQGAIIGDARLALQAIRLGATRGGAA